jgi:hypothetical protein
MSLFLTIDSVLNFYYRVWITVPINKLLEWGAWCTENLGPELRYMDGRFDCGFGHGYRGVVQ